MKKLIIALAIFFVACAGSDDVEFTGRNLALTVSGSQSFNPDIIHGKIEYYQITVTGPDLNEPFIQKFGGNSDSAQMLGIPNGTDRTIIVEAVNPNGQVIRRGKKEGVPIVAGQFTHIEIVMVSVPIFTNLADRSAISGKRLAFEIFGEPGSKLEIMEVIGEEASPVMERQSGRLLVNTSNNEGLFWHEPAEMNFGLHSFEVVDDVTQESSQITVTLYAGTVRPGISVNSGGYVRRQGEETVFAGAGQAYFRQVILGEEHLGNETMLDIVSMIY